MRISGSVQRTIRICLLGISCLFLLALAIYGLFFIANSHAHLVEWYMSLGPIYAQDRWESTFFTETVKMKGNLFGGVAFLLSSAGMFIVLKKIKRIPAAFQIRDIELHVLRDWIPATSLLLGLSGLWVYGNSNIQMAYDEAFSAVFVADAHPFHGLSYYMLPNNHVLFNLINNLIGAHLSNQVLTGRLISLFALLGLGYTMYFWFKRIVRNPWVAVAVVLAASTLLPVWGFSFQARGYMLVLWASWAAFISIQIYFEGRRRFWLVLLSASCFIGYATLPSFLYFHLSTLFFAVFLQFRMKEIDWDFWKSQVWSGVLVFLFYTPALTFSGIAAFSENRYVRATDMSHMDFAHQFISQLPEYANYGISNVMDARAIAGPLIFVLPLLLLPFAKNRTIKQVGLFAAVLFLTSLLIIIAMKATPFYRTLIFHLQFGIVAGFLLVIEGFQRISVFWNNRRKDLILMVAFVALSAFQTNRNLPFMSYTLYYYDINGTRESLIEFFDHIPENSAVTTSDEAFYFKIICAQRGLDRPVKDADLGFYLIKLGREELGATESDHELVFEKDGYQLLYITNMDDRL